MNKFNKKLDINNLEKHQSDELSQLVAGLKSDNHKDNCSTQWTREFAASGKNCVVVGVHEPLWTEKLPTCDKSGKITN